jgi:hypothetical protein
MNALFPYLTLRGTLLRSVALAAFFGLSSAAALASSRWATLEAIHQLENPTDSSRPGPYGELGAYQFRREVWVKYTRLPFSKALDRTTSDAVAVRHYEWLKVQLSQAGIQPTTYNIALAWNGGVSGVVRDTAPFRARDYAERAATLASSFEHETASD